jgi:hypothetical protein
MSRYKPPTGDHNQRHSKRTVPTPHQRRRQRARALAKHLATLSQHFPEFSHLIQDPLLLLEHQSNRALVLHAIHTGAWKIREIQTETRLPIAKLQPILKVLLESNIIFTTTEKDDNEKGGRPALLYLPSPNSHP